ncbi:hypothetical protein SDC9_105938 [bioreactor metagenome]|uniref:HTH cro/C1-type domain-containing protein n=1 Tax=bioreactor metagenome TaxID=1076179 RepID=A0A645B0Y5_9ZZZZ
MTQLSERLKEKRIEAGLSQTELANCAGVHLRSVQNYESGKRYPNSLVIVLRLASALNTTTEYLLGEEGGYIVEAGEKGGYTEQKEIKKLVSEVAGLFAGGKLSDEDRDAAMQALSEAYWIAKNDCRKYSPKKNTEDK